MDDAEPELPISNSYQGPLNLQAAGDDMAVKNTGIQISLAVPEDSLHTSPDSGEEVQKYFRRLTVKNFIRTLE